MPTSARCVDELVRALDQGHRARYLLFWGHRPEPDGRVGRGCLSQWWPASFTVDGTVFPSAEHYMMWRKALLFDDGATAAAILTATHPKQVKALGRQVGGFREEVWAEHRFGVVVDGSVAKFGQNPHERRFLGATGQRVLVEASPVDRVWGVGRAADDPDVLRPRQWRGANLLGFALMEARARLLDAP